MFRYRQRLALASSSRRFGGPVPFEALWPLLRADLECACAESEEVCGGVPAREPRRPGPGGAASPLDRFPP